MKRSNVGRNYPPRPEEWGLDMKDAQLSRTARVLTCRSNLLRNTLEQAKSREEALAIAARYIASMHGAVVTAGLNHKVVTERALEYLAQLTTPSFLVDAIHVHNQVALRVRREASTPKPGTTVHTLDNDGTGHSHAA